MNNYNFVYKTTNNINGDYYYGVHKTSNLNDGYIGSGLRLWNAVKKYGKENFTREIVQYFSDVKYAYRLEAAIVTPELVADPHCYNIAIGGYGGYVTAGYTAEQLKIRGQKISEGKKGKPMSDIGKQHIREAIKKIAQTQEWRNKISSTVRKTWSNKELREQQSKRLTGSKRSEETRKKMSDSRKGTTVSEEIKQRISNTLKGRHLSDQCKQKLSKLTANTIWINNNLISKRIKPEQKELFLSKGWQLGRLKK